ncbi:MAG: hypothetical protein KAU50_07750 [Candidatus Marinimicrobia bacterium]|nr:hypothetical protein [Candidatus Neomarinimicrobiota bacterium]
MNSLLVLAAFLAVAIGLAHSWLGEQYIIVRLFRRSDLPKMFGSDEFTRQTIRFAWHLTTIAWWGFAAVLMVLSGSIAGINVDRGLLLAIAFTFLASAALALVLTRGRHLSWVVFLAIAAICILVAF